MRWRHTDTDLYHQWEEAEERAEKWEKTAKEERKRREWEVSNIRAELRREMAQMRGELEGRIESITQENRELVNLSAEMSYAKSVQVSQAEVSRQTVCNKVIGLKEVVTEVKRAEETPKELHIFTDEDHVHLNGGKSVMVPIATITEGIDTSNPKRHTLMNPLRIAGYGMDGETFNSQVEACLNERYDINAVEKIYIHGDGAARIASLGEVFPNACHVLDGFHLEKYLKKLGHYEGASQRMGTLRKALKAGNWETYKKLLKDIIVLQSNKDREKCKKVAQYLWNNREAAYLRCGETICDSCTESIVSHVLSERLSRSPFSWSEPGLAKMAMLRVYIKNGGRVVADDIRLSIIVNDIIIGSMQNLVGFWRPESVVAPQPIFY